MATILHAADLHLDTQPSELRAYPDAVGQVLRDASLIAFDALVERAIAEQVTACVFAGDIYDGAQRGIRAQLRFRDGLERLDAAGITSVLVYGNHDPVEEGWSAIRAWPDGVVECAPGEPTTHVVDGRDGPVALHGISYATRATTDNLARRFGRSGDAPVQIGVLHTNVGDRPGHAPYAPCSLDDLRATGLDYWALGHIHTREVLAGPGPWVVYPGNLQGRSPRTSEGGAKGAMLIEVTDGSIPDPPRFVPLDVVRFDTVTVDASELADLGELAAALADAADERLGSHDGRSLVLRADIVGRVAWRTDLARPGALDEVRDQLQSPESSPFVWWDRLRDRTRSVADLDAAATGDDLLGHVLRLLDPAGAAELVDGCLGELPIDLGRLDVALPARDDVELADAARLLAYELLSEQA